VVRSEEEEEEEEAESEEENKAWNSSMKMMHGMARFAS
jgi:hypothetical protein